LAEFANAKTYHKGNDNLNEAQFGDTHFGHTGTSSTVMKRPETETRTTTRQHRGEKGGKWKKKGRKAVTP
jgi:hypothetical protein